MNDVAGIPSGKQIQRATYVTNGGKSGEIITRMRTKGNIRQAFFGPLSLKKKMIYGLLLTTREVKMTGYWPSSFSTCLWASSITRKKKSEASVHPF